MSELVDTTGHVEMIGSMTAGIVDQKQLAEQAPAAYLAPSYLVCSACDSWARRCTAVDRRMLVVTPQAERAPSVLRGLISERSHPTT